MFYVGLDIHDKRIAICVLGETGPIVRRAQVRTIDEMMRILEALPDRFEVCYEASRGYGHYHDTLSPIAARVTVAHPGRLRLIFRSKDKDDRKDAERLAKLLYLGEAPAVHVPAGDVRTWREPITCRGRVIAKRTRAKDSLRSLLRCAGVVPPGRPAPWTKKGLDRLRRLELPTASQQLRRDLLLEEIEALTRQATRIEEHLNQRAKPSPAVVQLRSIPGVGVRTAEAVAAFVDDPHRSRDAKAVGRYFGLVPSQDQSGDRNRPGHITREGPAVVRQLLAEATWQALRRSPAVRAYFERVRRGDPQRKKIALVATAHYLVRVMWALLKRGAVWDEGLAPADEPEGVAPAVAVIWMCYDKTNWLFVGSNGLFPHRASEPEGGGDPLMPDEVGGFAGGTSCRDVAGIVPASRGAHCRPLHPRLASLCPGRRIAHTNESSYFALLAGFHWHPDPRRIGTARRRLSRSRSGAGPRPHPEVRRGASRRRGMEWERPHTLSWRSAMADDAE
jgi:transposase